MEPGACVLLFIIKHLTNNYRKTPKNLDTYWNYPTIWLKRIFHRVIHPEDADRMANSVDPDQTAPRSSLIHRVMHPKDADRMENNIDPDQTAPSSSLIWVYTVCPDLSVRKLRPLQS